jgi:hypothetical protein
MRGKFHIDIGHIGADRGRQFTSPDTLVSFQLRLEFVRYVLKLFAGATPVQHFNNNLITTIEYKHQSQWSAKRSADIPMWKSYWLALGAITVRSIFAIS